MAVSTFGSVFPQRANERTLGLGLYTPPTPPPVGPTTTRPWFSISNPDGLTGFERTQDEIVGHDFDAHRVFHSSFVSNPTTLLQPEIAAGRIPIYSNKPPTSNVVASYATLAGHLEALGGLILMTVDHEPENSMTAAQFEINYMQMWNGLSHLPNVWLGPVYMAVTSTSSTRAEFRALLDTMPMDFIGVDGYNSQNNRNFSQIFNWYALKARSRSVPWAVCEWSTHGTPEQRSAHVASARTYWENPVNNDLVIVSWFDSDGGNNAGPAGWRIERALPDNWAVIDGISQAVAPPPEYVEDLLTPGTIFDALQTPRRNVGPVAPPEPPATPLQRGALPLGDAEYPIPAGAVYVSTTGVDTNGGTLAAPKATINSAAAVTGATAIVLREGTYRQEAVLPHGRELIIQNYPGEAVWMCGSVVVTGWLQDGARWRRNNWTTNFNRTAADTVDPAFPLAPWPEQVWINGAALEQVGSLAEVGTTVTEVDAPGTFWYDTTNRVMWIGTTPFNKTVEIAVLQIAIRTAQTPTTNPPKFTLRGIGVKHYATSQASRGAVQIHGDLSLVENCHLHGNSSAGVFVNSAAECKIRLNTMEWNGQLGYRVFRGPLILVEQNWVYRNNRKRNASYGAAGGGKIDTDSLGAIVRNNYGEKNYGHCFWIDVYSHGSVFVGNEVVDNTLGAGCYAENMNGGIMCGNRVRGCVHGLLSSESGNQEIWNNTIIDCTNPLIYQLGTLNPEFSFNYTARNNIVSQRNNHAAQAVYTAIDTVNNGRDWIEMNWSTDNNAVWMKFAQIYARLTIPGGTRPTYATQAALLAATAGVDENTVSTSGGTVDPYLNTDDKTPKPVIVGQGIEPPQQVKDIMIAAGLWTTVTAAGPWNIGAI